MEIPVVQDVRMLCGMAECGPLQFLMGYCSAMKQTEISCGCGSLRTSIACFLQVFASSGPEICISSVKWVCTEPEGAFGSVRWWLVGGSACRPQLEVSSSGLTLPFGFSGGWTSLYLRSHSQGSRLVARCTHGHDLAKDAQLRSPPCTWLASEWHRLGV